LSCSVETLASSSWTPKRRRGQKGWPSRDCATTLILYEAFGGHTFVDFQVDMRGITYETSLLEDGAGVALALGRTAGEESGTTTV
jgi:hypothetical protein